MSLYRGPALSGALVRLIEPDDRVEPALRASDLTDRQKSWFGQAAEDPNALYFAIERAGEIVGQCGLHDADWPAGEAMVGYHIFQPSGRGRRSGIDAIRTLVRYCENTLGLRRLVAITSRDNIASQRAALRAGFRAAGTARESDELLVFVWEQAMVNPDA